MPPHRCCNRSVGSGANVSSLEGGRRHAAFNLESIRGSVERDGYFMGTAVVYPLADVVEQHDLVHFIVSDAGTVAGIGPADGTLAPSSGGAVVLGSAVRNAAPDPDGSVLVVESGYTYGVVDNSGDAWPPGNTTKTTAAVPGCVLYARSDGRYVALAPDNTVPHAPVAMALESAPDLVITKILVKLGTIAHSVHQ